MILIGTDEGIYRRHAGSPWPVFHSLQGRKIVDLASPGGGVLAALDGAGRLLETVDNGQVWREIPLPEGVERPTALAVWETSIVLAARPLGLYRRPIGASTGLEVEASRLAAILWRARRLVPAAVGGGVATAPPPERTPDLAGWSPLAVPAVADNGHSPAIRTLAIGQGESSPWFAAVAGLGLWRSADDGGTWTRCPGLPNEVFSIRTAPHAAGTVAAATSDGVWMSPDDGLTWEDRSQGLEGSRHVRAVEIRPGDPKTLLAGAAPAAPGTSGIAPRGGLGFALFESKDGGASWKHLVRGFPETLEFDPIADIRYDPADPEVALVALASGEIWNTRNDGFWWEPLARQIQAARVLCAVD